MSGKKGMKKYPAGIREAIVKELKEGRSQRELSLKYGVSRYAIQSWCGLRPEAMLRQTAPLAKGRPKKGKTIEDYEKENRRLKMENELLRDFLSLTRKG